jgi:serine/threonine protein kinase
VAVGQVDGEQLEAGVRLGDFEIEKRLGAGGMGIVYQARQVSLNRRVALKVLSPALTRGSGLARFQREAQAVARLQHPGIATLHSVGQEAELCYHVMELVDGLPLRRVINRLTVARDVQSGPDSIVAGELAQPPPPQASLLDQPTTDHVGDTVIHDDLPLSAEAKQIRTGQQYVRRCCEIVRDTAQALAYAHGAGVIHRDIKPENLMLDQQGRVHIIDFGLARFRDDLSITNTGQLVGTPLYMSPEQVSGRIKVDHRTDIYSLGLVLYELLALRQAIDATSRENVLRNIVAKPLPPLCCRNRSLPRALEAIVHKATHKDPEERYQSATELAADLERFLEGKPVSAPIYRYRFDARETVANRPGAVVLSALLHCLVGIATCLLLACLSLMVLSLGAEDRLLNGAAYGLPALAVLGSAVIGTFGLLKGWNWARWVVLVQAGLFSMTCLAFGVYMWVDVAPTLQSADPVQLEEAPQASEKPAPKFDQRTFVVVMLLMYGIPLSLGLLCAAVTFLALVLPPTRAGFRSARQARLEHERVLRLLGD